MDRRMDGYIDTYSHPWKMNYFYSKQFLLPEVQIYTTALSAMFIINKESIRKTEFPYFFKHSTK